MPDSDQVLTLPTGQNHEQQQPGQAGPMDVLIYGGFSGDAVEGDVVKIDGKVRV